MATAKRTLLEKKIMGEMHNFEEVPELTGTVSEVRETTTKHGVCDVIDIVTADGEKKSCFKSAGLKGYDWIELVGKNVTIEAKGYTKGKNGIFLDYNVFLNG